MASFRVAIILALAAAFVGPVAAPATSATPKCEMVRPIRLAGLDWDSDRFHVAVAHFILKHGFGCESEVTPGSTIPLLTGLARGDLDVVMEVWKGQLTEVWEKAERAGKVKLMGINFPDAIQGWFVPRYVVEGEAAPAKGLVAVADLPRYKHVFSDPEEPGKGRFYNCKLGWDCETINTKKLSVYGLTNHITNFRPGSAAALAAVVAASHERKKPILHYYWGPSWIMAKYDMVMLTEPEHDPAIWKALKASDNPGRACAYPLVTVYTGANAKFAEAAPTIAGFLKSYRTSNEMVGRALLYLQTEKGARIEDAATHFLDTNPDVWKTWLAPNVAQRVEAALAGRARKARL